MLTYPVPFVSRINVYFRISRWATNLQKLEVGFSTWPYMWVTRSRTTSFCMSGVNLFSSMAFIMEGCHLVGIVKLNKLVLVGEIVVDATVLGKETVETSDRLGEGDSMEGE